MPDQIVTKEGYEKLKKELEQLTKTKRREIAERIQKAKDMGDLSENAEYSEAKDEQALNEGRIVELESMLKNVTVVENGGAEGEVNMGSRVTVMTDKKEKEYVIVSFNEVDPIAGKISNESPLGRAFLGRKEGSKVKVETPKGEVIYKIIKVE